MPDPFPAELRDFLDALAELLAEAALNDRQADN